MFCVKNFSLCLNLFVRIHEKCLFHIIPFMYLRLIAFVLQIKIYRKALFRLKAEKHWKGKKTVTKGFPFKARTNFLREIRNFILFSELSKWLGGEIRICLMNDDDKSRFSNLVFLALAFVNVEGIFFAVSSRRLVSDGVVKG